MLRLEIIEPSSDVSAEISRRPSAAYDLVVIETFVGGEKRGCSVYRLAASKLKPGGVLAARARQPLDCLVRLFPASSVWSPGAQEVILLSRQPAAKGIASLDESFSQDEAAAWLKPLGVSYTTTLLSLQVPMEELSRYLARRRQPLLPYEYLEILQHPRAPYERARLASLLRRAAGAKTGPREIVVPATR